MIGQIDFIGELKSKNKKLENEIIYLNNILSNIKNKKIKKAVLLHEESTNNTTNNCNKTDKLKFSDIFDSNKTHNLLNIIQDINSINFKSNLVNPKSKNNNFFGDNEKFFIKSKTLNDKIDHLETQNLNYLNNINLLNNTISELKIKNKLIENNK